MTSDIGNKIHEYRTEKGISQNKLAKLAGVSQAGLSAIESSTKSPSISTVERIAKALNVSVAELMGETIDDRSTSDDDIKFALFGVDPAHITDEQYEEVKRFAKFVREQESKR